MWNEWAHKAPNALAKRPSAAMAIAVSSGVYLHTAVEAAEKAKHDSVNKTEDESDKIEYRNPSELRGWAAVPILPTSSSYNQKDTSASSVDDPFAVWLSDSWGEDSSFPSLLPVVRP